MSAPHGPIVFGPFVPMPTATVELASAQLMDSSAVTLAVEQAVSLHSQQHRIFQMLGLTDEDAKAKFGFLLEAFKYGPPPHGGIAAGVDRLAMLLCGADSLRDVIAFPKTQKGTDLMTEAPGPVVKRQLDELHIALKE